MISHLYNEIKRASGFKTGLVLFIIAFVLRASYALYIYLIESPPKTNAYYEIAELILQQGKLFYHTGHPYYESAGPVIPWLNALTMKLFGQNYLGLYIVTALGSALVTLFTYKTARLFLDRGASLLAGLWSTFYLFYFYFTPSPGKDIWMSFMMIILVYNLIVLFVKARFTYARLILFSFLFAIAIHLDERFFIFTPFIGLYILYSETSGFKKVAVTKTLVFGIVLILLMIPWTVRNYHEHGKIVLITTRTEAFTDPVFGYDTRKHMMDEYNDIYGKYYIHDYQYDSVISGNRKFTDMGREISPAMVEAMKRGKLPEPLTGIRAFWSRTVTLLEPVQFGGRYERSGYFYYKKSPRHNMATFLFYGVMFIFSIPGFYFIYLIDRKIFAVLITVISVYTLVHALSIPYTNWRYRLPLDAIFILAGSYGMVNSFRKIKDRIKRRL